MIDSWQLTVWVIGHVGNWFLRANLNPIKVHRKLLKHFIRNANFSERSYEQNGFAFQTRFETVSLMGGTIKSKSIWCFSAYKNNVPLGKTKQNKKSHRHFCPNVANMLWGNHISFKRSFIYSGSSSTKVIVLSFTLRKALSFLSFSKYSELIY